MLLQEILTLIVGAIALAGLVAAALSLRWTTRHSTRILSRALGRPVGEQDQTSLRTWMSLPDAQLESGTRELQQNPFDPVADALDDIGSRLNPQLQRGSDDR